MIAKAVLSPLFAIGLVVAVVSAPEVAEAKGVVPTLTLVEWCPVIDGVQFYGVEASLSGFPPFTPFEGSLLLDGSGGYGSFTTDAAGNFGPIGISEAGPVGTAVATVTYFGGTLTESFENPCQGPRPPTSKAQCKKGGFVGFGFKNQGRCVSFVVARSRR